MPIENLPHNWMYVAFLEDEDEVYVGRTAPLPRDGHSLGSQLAYFKIERQRERTIISKISKKLMGLITTYGAYF